MTVSWRVECDGRTPMTFPRASGDKGFKAYVKVLFRQMPFIHGIRVVRITEEPTFVIRGELAQLDECWPDEADPVPPATNGRKIIGYARTAPPGMHTDERIA